MTEHRYLPPLRYGPRKREYVYAALALSLALFAAYGGDKPEDRVLEPLPLPTAQYCPRLRDGQFLRAMVRHTNEEGFHWHDCHYGPVWLEVANEHNGH